MHPTCVIRRYEAMRNAAYIGYLIKDHSTDFYTTHNGKYISKSTNQNPSFLSTSEEKHFDCLLLCIMQKSVLQPWQVSNDNIHADFILILLHNINYQLLINMLTSTIYIVRPFYIVTKIQHMWVIVRQIFNHIRHNIFFI